MTTIGYVCIVVLLSKSSTYTVVEAKLCVFVRKLKCLSSILFFLKWSDFLSVRAGGRWYDFKDEAPWLLFHSYTVYSLFAQAKTIQLHHHPQFY